jgi:predicted AlkP superfamily phosphohydrolase/phosphomutase
VHEILVTGIISGTLYFVVNLLRFFPSEQLALMDGGFLRFNLFAYSFTVWVLAFIVVSAVLHVATYPLTSSWGRSHVVVGRAIVYFVIALAFLAGHAVWMSYADTAPMLPSYVKIQEVKTSLVSAALIAGVTALALALLKGLGSARPAEAKRGKPVLVFFALACLVYFGLVNMPFDYADLGGMQDEGPYPGRVQTVVFGVDAGTWNVILPFLERGELPAFGRMMNEGSYGYMDTYGRQLTPPSWTSIATGKKEAKHGVHDFGALSTDWQAAPVWSIVSSAGKRVGVVNWVCTWPPFEVTGGFISKITDPRAGSSHLSEEFGGYRAVAESILAGREPGRVGGRGALLEQAEGEITKLGEIHEEVISGIDPDLAAYFYYSTDALQHFYWKDMAPGLFTGKDWADEASDASYSQAIKEAWLWADGFLGELMDTYGEYADYIVVSDHGARPIDRRQVQLDIVGLLEELGYLKTQDGEIRYESSVCYPSKAGSPHYVFDIDINPSEYTDASGGSKDRYGDLRAKIVADLMAVRLGDSGKPIFQAAQLPGESDDEDQPDIRLSAARGAMEMPPEGSLITVGRGRAEARKFFSYHPWSGRHRARGIILAKGPAIKHRYTGAWTIDDPYTRIFRYTHGIFAVMDRFKGPLERLHLIDEVMNLDITPTLLYLMGLPVALDMDGRVVEEIIESDFKRSHPVRTVAAYRMGETLDLRGEPEEEQKIKERLRALGYIQ